MAKQTFKQKLLKALYPFIKKVSKGRFGKVLTNKNNTAPKTSFYDLEAVKNNGKAIPFSDFKGKKVLLVNTASNCGFTGQYEELQSIYDQYNGELEIIGFPANDFKEQEAGNDDEISQFCQINYGVTFPIAKKSSVVKGEEQLDVFKWLSNKEENGWSDQAPEWNFNKFLINEEGVLTHYFGSSIAPTDQEFIDAVKS